jgi:hypothetical protein
MSFFDAAGAVAALAKRLDSALYEFYGTSRAHPGSTSRDGGSAGTGYAVFREWSFPAIQRPTGVPDMPF